ncbi:unnamed protein product [Cuscuta epithymum]|uniref:Uncharacterized protein n=1 Tax=Cuscuta epithymum TaxID=186058 RepID=A0AAV0FII8_9ASTE|nr:unnamed protein product [Cuscuta epithymum]
MAQKRIRWKNYNKIANDISEKNRQKFNELNITYKKIESDVKKINELQMSNLDLENKISNMKAISVKQNGEIFRLSNEPRSLKNRKRMIPRTVSMKNGKRFISAVQLSHPHLLQLSQPEEDRCVVLERQFVELKNETETIQVGMTELKTVN